MAESLELIKTLMCEVPHFDQLDNEELEILGRHVMHRKEPEGMVICKEGSVGDSLFYIVDGKIEIKKESVDGRQTVLAQFHKGSTVGEMALIERSPRSATAVALENVELLILTRESFDRILEEHPPIGVKILQKIAQSLSNRLRHTSGRFADIFK